MSISALSSFYLFWYYLEQLIVIVEEKRYQDYFAPNCGTSQFKNHLDCNWALN